MESRVILFYFTQHEAPVLGITTWYTEVFFSHRPLYKLCLRGRSWRHGWVGLV